MSVTFEVRVDARDVERTLTALRADVWTLDLFGDGVVLALFREATLEEIRARVPFAREVRSLGAKVPAEWVAWREPLRAIQAGPLWIANERSAPCPFGQYNLRLITKDAFGTGLHETTLLCLQRILELSPVERILDVGTGSGILAFSALKLGAQHASATEIDPRAREAAAQNATNNNLAARFQIFPAIPDNETFPLVVANIIAPVLHELAANIATAVAAGGTLLLSGLRDHEVDLIAQRYEGLGLKRGPGAKRGGWNRLELVRA